MKYIRKTYDEWYVEVNYGSGYEVVTHEETFADAKQMARDYRNNTPYPVRITKHRVKMGD